jgi:hypothetical protein
VKPNLVLWRQNWLKVDSFGLLQEEDEGNSVQFGQQQNISEHGGPWYEKPNKLTRVPREINPNYAQRIQKNA